MNSEKYIGLDVHQATKAATILEFFAGVRGTFPGWIP